MRTISLFLCLGLMLLCVACGTGSNNNSGGFGGGGTAGSFSNSNLSGNYAYQITGYDLSSTTGTAIPFREAGVFDADGKGNVTTGEDDFAEGSSVGTISITSGTYSISKDGTGLLTLNFSNNGGVQVALSLQSSPTVYLAVNVIAPNGTQLAANGTGVAALQTTSAFSAAPSGNFVFRMHDVGTTGSSALVGGFTAAGGNITAGNVDEALNAAESQLTLTGAFNTPDANGRGTGTFTDGNAVTWPFDYYVIDSTHLYLFSTAPGNIGVGQLEGQSGTFSTTSVSGSYVFGSRGDDAFAFGGVNTVGQFTASNGTISGGQFDSVQDGSPSTGTFSGGSYTVASNGRAVINLAASTGNIQEIYWMVRPGRAFFLTNDATKVEDGTADLQQTNSFSKSSVNGQFGFATDGFVLTSSTTIDFYDRAGYLHWDGAGNLGLTEFINVTGSGQPSGILKGTYTVSSNGRAVGSISSLSSNLVFYLISSNQAYMLQADTGVEINGMMGQFP